MSPPVKATSRLQSPEISAATWQAIAVDTDFSQIEFNTSLLRPPKITAREAATKVQLLIVLKPNLTIASRTVLISELPIKYDEFATPRIRAVIT